MSETEHKDEKHASEAASPKSEAPKVEANASNDPQWMPEGVKTLKHTIGNKLEQMRTAAIVATPAMIVNNSSNFLATSHVATEMLMFKSGMKGAKLIDNPGNPINWIKEPIQKILSDVLTKSKARDYSPRQLFTGSFSKNFRTYVLDTNAASHRELDRQIAQNQEFVAAGKSAPKLSLGNPWQTRSTFAGLMIWSISALLPERKESDEEIERMATMRTLHPVQYAATRLKQALWVPEWTTHKREMLGLGYFIIGICSMFGAWRNRRELLPHVAEDLALINKGVKEAYTFNGGYFFTALTSFIAGIPLMFALDERRAYSNYGAVSLLRIPFLPSSIYSKYDKKELGRHHYLVGKLTFQIEDFLFSMIGGATKKVNPDGSVEIVDHEALKREAIRKARDQKTQNKLEKKNEHKPRIFEAALDRNVDSPAPTIAGPAQVERAMPERVAAQQQEAIEV